MLVVERMIKMELNEVIDKRRSIRKYINKEISKEYKEKISNSIKEIKKLIIFITFLLYVNK